MSNTEKEKTPLNLGEVKVGDTVTVKKLNGEGLLRRRIMDMGITKGTDIYVRKLAPLGDPMEIEVRGYSLSIRKSEANLIEIVPCDESCHRVTCDKHKKNKKAKKAEKLNYEVEMM